MKSNCEQNGFNPAEMMKKFMGGMGEGEGKCNSAEMMKKFMGGQTEEGGEQMNPAAIAALPKPGQGSAAKNGKPKRGRFNSFVGTIEYMAPEMISGVGHSFAVDFWIVGVMLYEMLYGITAFRGRDAQTTFLNITSLEVSFNHPLTIGKPKVSNACKDLIRKLLVKDQKKRLGYAAGVGEIKATPFFKDIHWDLLRNQEAPLLPPVAVLDESKAAPLDAVLEQLSVSA